MHSDLTVCALIIGTPLIYNRCYNTSTLRVVVIIAHTFRNKRLRVAIFFFFFVPCVLYSAVHSNTPRVSHDGVWKEGGAVV